MSDDLVGALRLGYLGDDDGAVGDAACRLMERAADELERLQRGNKRMRGALEDIADGLGEDAGDWAAIGRFAPAVARNALRNSDTREGTS